MRERKDSVKCCLMFLVFYIVKIEAVSCYTKGDPIKDIKESGGTNILSQNFVEHVLQELQITILSIHPYIMYQLMPLFQLSGVLPDIQNLLLDQRVGEEPT